MLRSELARGKLGAQRPHGRRGRPDELQAGCLARIWKSGFLGEESITGMNGVGAAVVRHLHDAL